MFGFEKLDVWQFSMDFANRIYQATKPFPADERFGITSQLRRAAVSISANIAEGSSRASGREYIRFVEIAYGSLMECVSHLSNAHRLKYLTDEDYANLYRDAERLVRMLSGLRSSINKNATAHPSDHKP